MTAKMGSFSRTASESLFKTTIPQPSPRPYPSPLASNVLHLPSDASARRLQRGRNPAGPNSKLTPPARAKEDSPLCKLSQAKCTATSDDEQAVSREIDGPCTPKM